MGAPKATNPKHSPGPRTLFEKVWDNHVVVQEKDAPALLYIDLHLVHEVTSPQAFANACGDVTS